MNLFQGIIRGEETGNTHRSHKSNYQIFVGRSRGGNILEGVDLGFMVFTKALLRRSSYWKDNAKVGSGEYGMDFSITGISSMKGMIDNSNQPEGFLFLFFSKGFYIIDYQKMLEIQGSI